MEGEGFTFGVGQGGGGTSTQPWWEVVPPTQDFHTNVVRGPPPEAWPEASTLYQASAPYPMEFAPPTFAPIKQESAAELPFQWAPTWADPPMYQAEAAGQIVASAPSAAFDDLHLQRHASSDNESSPGSPVTAPTFNEPDLFAPAPAPAPGALPRHAVAAAPRSQM